MWNELDFFSTAAITTDFQLFLKDMILIVDDTPENLISLKKVLELNGFEVDTASSGEEALKKVLKKSYVLIILDVQMPDMDGFEVAETLSGYSGTRDTAVIFLTAVNTDIQYVKKGYLSGGLDYITKPVDLNILLHKVKIFYRIYEQNRRLAEMRAALEEEVEIRKEAEKKKDQFISVASHELKTPLTSIKGYIQLLQRTVETESKDKMKAQLSKVQDQVEKLTTLVTDLLDMSQIESGKLRLNKNFFSIDDLLNHVIEVTQQTSTGVEISRTGYAGREVYGDEMRIEQVIINFITNAVKYSPREKKVDIRVKVMSDQVYLGVRDYGIGIDKVHQKEIFEKFYRVEENAHRFQGLGIGLFICKQIIENHSGEIGVKNAEGGGSEFYFTIPFVPAEAISDNKVVGVSRN